MFSYILHPNYLKWHVRTIAKSGWVGEGDWIGTAGLDYEWKQTDRNDLEYGKQQGWSLITCRFFPG